MPKAAVDKSLAADVAYGARLLIAEMLSSGAEAIFKLIGAAAPPEKGMINLSETASHIKYLQFDIYSLFNKGAVKSKTAIIGVILIDKARRLKRNSVITIPLYFYRQSLPQIVLIPPGRHY